MSRQLFALLRKNWLLKKRMMISTLLEILLPTIVLTILVLLRRFSNHEDHEPSLHLNSTQHFNTNTYTALMLVQMNFSQSAIALIPSTAFPEMDSYLTFFDENPITRELLPNLPKDSFIKRFNTTEEFYVYLKDPLYGTETHPLIHAAITEHDDTYATYDPHQTYDISPRSSLDPHQPHNLAPPKFQYSIRMNASNDVAIPSYQTVPDTRQPVVDLLQPGAEFEKWTRYANLGFFLLQQLQDLFILNRTGVIELPPMSLYLPDVLDNYFSVTAQPFPTPAYSSDLFLRSLGDNIGLFFTLVFIYTVTRITASLVEEKELKLAEGMRIMGLKKKWLIISWLITYFVMFVLSCGILSATIAPKLFSYSNPLLVFVFFLCFCLSVFSFGFFMSTMMNKASVASTFSAIVFLCIFFVYYTVNKPGVGRTAKLLASLSPPVALGLGATALAQLEQGLVGASFSTAFNQYNGYSFGDSIIALLIDAAVLFIIALYLEQVIPGEYGPTNKWYFPFTWFISLFSCHTKKNDGQSSLLDDDVFASLPDNESYTKVEPATRSQQNSIGMKLRHIRKEFDVGAQEPFVAVKNMNMDLYTGEITVLLGHNGAGKTVLISTLTGMLEPTSGDVEMLGGLHLSSDLDEIRQSYGYCPQHDLLWPTLTVREHLELYCAIKNAPTDPKIQNQMILDIIEDVGLAKDNKEHAFAMSLSGGQKRKLSVAIAFLNNSKIVFLDESSSGMDVSAQRDLWSLIQRNKAGRIILMTTHSMEEAEIGDRIAIMAHSRLQCVGSSLFLKQAYGAGYTLTITKKQQMQQFTKSQLKLHPQCTTISGSVIANYLLPRYHFLTINTDAGMEISFKMSFGFSNQFVTLFEDLDVNGDTYGLRSYSMSVTTLTEIFLAVGHGQDFVEGVHDVRAQENTTADDISDDDNDDDISHQHASHNLHTPASSSELMNNLSMMNQTYSHLDYSTSSIDPSQLDLLSNQNSLQSLNSPKAGDVNAPSQIIPTNKNLKNGQEYYTLRQVFKNHHFDQISVFTIYVTHITALIAKRIHNLKRDKKTWAWQLGYPFLILFASLLVMRLTNVDEYPTRVMNAGNLYHQFGGYVPYTQTSDLVTELVEGIHGDFAPHLTPVKPEDIPIIPVDPEAFNFYNKGDLTEHDFITNEEFQTWLLNSQANVTVNRQLALTINTFKPDADSSLKETFFSGIVHFNTTAQDALPVGINMLSNSLLRHHYKTQHNLFNDPSITEDDLPSITVINNPLPRTENEKIFVSSTTSLFIGLAFSFVPATFVGYLVKEKSDKSKHLQYMAGVTPFAYWLATYIWDILNFIGPFTTAMVCLYAFSVKSLVDPSVLGLTCLSFWLYQLATAPFSYIISFFFTSPSSAQNLTLLLNFFLSVILLLTSMIMSVLPSTQHADSILRFVYRLFPSFSFGEALLVISLNRATFVDAGSLYWPLTYLALEAVGYFILLLIIDYMIINSTMTKIRRAIIGGGEVDIPVDYNVEEDDDVVEERRRVMAGECSPEDYSLIINGIRKVYPSFAGRPPFVAVNNFHLAVKRGECFALMGQNGAGKSSIQKVLTQDETPSPHSGPVTFAGLDLMSQPTKVKQLTGYCPQFDALIPNLTGREHLTLFCRLKLVPTYQVNGLVNYLVHKLGLNHLADRAAGSYSGGTKRRLSLGIALIGSRIVLLDEVSAGVDQANQRDIWRIITSIKKDRCILLISHAMAEVEALADRLAIMASGSIRTINSPHMLKAKYGDGYQVLLKSKEDRGDDMVSWFHSQFEGIEIVEHHGVNYTLKIPKVQHCLNLDDNKTKKMSFKTIFEIIEQYKSSAASTMDSYSVSDTDLEHIFIQFVEQDNRRKRNAALNNGNSLPPYFLGSPTPDDNSMIPPANNQDPDQYLLDSQPQYVAEGV